MIFRHSRWLVFIIFFASPMLGLHLIKRFPDWFFRCLITAWAATQISSGSQSSHSFYFSIITIFFFFHKNWGFHIAQVLQPRSSSAEGSICIDHFLTRRVEIFPLGRKKEKKNPVGIIHHLIYFPVSHTLQQGCTGESAPLALGAEMPFSYSNNFSPWHPGCICHVAEEMPFESSRQ